MAKRLRELIGEKESLHKGMFAAWVGGTKEESGCSSLSCTVPRNQSLLSRLILESFQVKMMDQIM